MSLPLSFFCTFDFVHFFVEAAIHFVRVTSCDVMKVPKMVTNLLRKIIPDK